MPVYGLVSSPGEFHAEALAEPHMNVSAHTVNLTYGCNLYLLPY